MAHKITSDYGIFVVADGLGGHQAGEKASYFFCQGLIRQTSNYQPLLKQARPKAAKAIMANWLTAAVDEMSLLFAGDQHAKNAHTTCVVLYLSQYFTATAHCGDSRIYRLHPKKVLWRTKDHSLIQKQRDEGHISEREMGLHPEQNQLTRSINIEKLYPAEIHIYPSAKTGETFILCTDGFWEFIKEKDLLQLGSPECDLDELKKIAKLMHFRAHGKGDNLTVQWIRIT